MHYTKHALRCAESYASRRVLRLCFYAVFASRVESCGFEDNSFHSFLAQLLFVKAAANKLRSSKLEI